MRRFNLLSLLLYAFLIVNVIFIIFHSTEVFAQEDSRIERVAKTNVFGPNTHVVYPGDSIQAKADYAMSFASSTNWQVILIMPGNYNQYVDLESKDYDADGTLDWAHRYLIFRGYDRKAVRVGTGTNAFQISSELPLGSQGAGGVYVSDIVIENMTLDASNSGTGSGWLDIETGAPWTDVIIRHCDLYSSRNGLQGDFGIDNDGDGTVDEPSNLSIKNSYINFAVDALTPRSNDSQLLSMNNEYFCDSKDVADRSCNAVFNLKSGKRMTEDYFGHCYYISHGDIYNGKKIGGNPVADGEFWHELDTSGVSLPSYCIVQGLSMVFRSTLDGHTLRLAKRDYNGSSNTVIFKDIDVTIYSDDDPEGDGTDDLQTAVGIVGDHANQTTYVDNVNFRLVGDGNFTTFDISAGNLYVKNTTWDKDTVGTLTFLGGGGSSSDTNAPTQGTATLSTGTVTVSTKAVTANSRIFLTPIGTGTGILNVGTITAGTSFVINSSDGSDTRNVNWSLED